MLIESSAGLDRGMKLLARPDQRQGRRRCEQFCIRGGDKQLVGVLRVQYLPGIERHDLNTPKAARQAGIGKDGVDSRRQGPMFGGLKLGRSHKPQDCEDSCPGPPHSWILALGEPEFPGLDEAAGKRPGRVPGSVSGNLQSYRYAAGLPMGPGRSEERRVGKECQSLWWPYRRI